MNDVRVPVGACRCPGTPHVVDWVELMPRPSIDIGSAIYAAVAAVGQDPVLLQVEMTRAYLRFGIVAWSFTDERGEPIPIRPRAGDFGDVISRLLPFTDGGYAVANEADSLYSEEVLRPLMTRLSRMHSQGGQMAGSTSATLRTSSTRPKRSRPSSRPDTAGRPSADQDG
jgi:hypothetical protein